MLSVNKVSIHVNENKRNAKNKTHTHTNTTTTEIKYTNKHTHTHTNGYNEAVVTLFIYFLVLSDEFSLIPWLQLGDANIYITYSSQHYLICFDVLLYKAFCRTGGKHGQTDRQACQYVIGTEQNL